MRADAGLSGMDILGVVVLMLLVNFAIAIIWAVAIYYLKPDMPEAWRGGYVKKDKK